MPGVPIWQGQFGKRALAAAGGKNPARDPLARVRAAWLRQAAAEPSTNRSRSKGLLGAGAAYLGSSSSRSARSRKARPCRVATARAKLALSPVLYEPLIRSGAKLPSATIGVEL